MHTLRNAFLPALFAVAVLSACGGQQSSSTATIQASAIPTEAATAAPEATAAVSPGAPTPEPTPTPNNNLLAFVNGTIMRSYPASMTSPNEDPGTGISVQDASPSPLVWVYELPGVATVTSFNLRFPEVQPSTAPPTGTIAVSTTSATSGFNDVGTITGNADGTAQTLAVNNVSARWIRITVNTSGTTAFNSFVALGTLALRPSGLLDGAMYADARNPYADGAFVGVGKDTDPWYEVATNDGNGLTISQCEASKIGDTYPGMLDGRTWNFTSDDGHMDHGVVNDDGSIIAGMSSGDIFVRTTQKPKFCAPQKFGSGPHKFLVLDQSGFQGLYPIDENAIPGYEYTRVGGGMLSSAVLQNKEAVITNALCDTSRYFNAVQGNLLTQFVSSGHKLLIYDADMCSPRTAYAFLPYQFTTSNPGATGSSGKHLIQVEDDELGTSDKTDKAHFFDPAVYVAGGNQIGDANTVTTQDPHWCGHLFGTNVQNVNGFMQMYSLYGKGVIIYDGFDHDDGGVPSYQRLRQLEFALPVPTDLGCTQKASLGFIIEPNRTGTFVPGKAATLTFPMELLANQGWEGRITIATTGDFPATLTPNVFSISGGIQALSIAVHVPKNAKPGTYAIIVNATGVTTGNVATPSPGSSPSPPSNTNTIGVTSTAQATVQLVANVPMVKQLKVQRRIRLYGIHFDVDSARIQPVSEPVIAQIAEIMKQNPSWRFRVEGHTDSDGGFAHNMVLSQHRAESVVADLMHRYHIAASRLVPKGYGYTRPVASNATSAGKALNRRVELFRL